MKKLLKIITGVSLSAFLALNLTGCSQEEKVYNDTIETTSSSIQLKAPQAGDTVAEIVTSVGTIKVLLFTQEAPLATENFITHIENGYYNDVIFHRVIKDFVIQSGDPTGTGTGGESVFGVKFADEFSENLHNYTGALSMANSGEDTNGSQFFIVATSQNSISDSDISKMEAEGYSQEVITAYKEVGGLAYLDYVHTVFGQVYEGLDIVYEISDSETDSNNKPTEEIKIISASVYTVE